MNVDRTLPTLLLPISCFDKRRAKPLPVYNRWYWLDWAKLDDMQRAEILHIVGNEERNSQHRPVGFDETIITMSVGSPNDGRQILKYRNSFDAVPDNDIEAFYNDPARHQGAFQTMNCGFEYFEDENGMPISKYQMIEHVSGQALPILLGDPQSVVRLGPMSAANSGSWTVAKANTIGQFLDVVERIYASEWFRSPHFITSLSQKTGESKLLEAQFPDDAETMSVLAYFRQLHAGDKLLVKACDA